MNDKNMMKDEINVNIKKINYNSAAVKREAQSVSDDIEELRGIISSFGSGWQGEAADEYLEGINADAEELLNIKNSLLRTADAIEKSAALYYGHQMKCEEIITELKRIHKNT